MTDPRNPTICQVNGKTAMLRDVTTSLKAQGRADLVHSATIIMVTDEVLTRAGISVSDEELQQAFNEFRTEARLHTAESTQGWLTEHRLSLEDLEKYLERAVGVQKLMDAFPQAEVQDTFSRIRPRFDKAKLSQIVIGSEEVGYEILRQIEDMKAEFPIMAQRHSMNEANAEACGFLGWVTREELGDPLADQVFSASRGQVLGPIRAEHTWRLIKVWETVTATLDTQIERTIRNLMFQQGLEEEVSRAVVTQELDA